jgi:hypothetical protein
MKTRIVLLVFFLSHLVGLALAQETRLKYIGIETGMTYIRGEISDKQYIRGEMPAYYMGYSTNSITSWSYKSFVGIKYEIFSLNDRFGLLGGLRFSHMNSSIGKSDYLTSNTDYFYWLYSQDGTNTEYLKIKEINQNANYIGIPLEIRFFTEKRPRVFQLYIKLGIEVSYLLRSETNIVFENAAMRIYERELISMLEKPEKFSAAIYGGGGFKIGGDQKPSVSIEACMPYIVLNPGSSGILKPIIGGGFQLNFQVPIKSKAQ